MCFSLYWYSQFVFIVEPQLSQCVNSNCTCTLWHSICVVHILDLNICSIWKDVLIMISESHIKKRINYMCAYKYLGDSHCHWFCGGWTSSHLKALLGYLLSNVVRTLKRKSWERVHAEKQGQLIPIKSDINTQSKYIRT